MAEEIEKAGLDPQAEATTNEELELTRQRQDALRDAVKQLERRKEEWRKWIGLDKMRCETHYHARWKSFAPRNSPGLPTLSLRTRTVRVS